MNARENQVRRFQEAMEQPIDIPMSSKELMLRMSFIDEEVSCNLRPPMQLIGGREYMCT